MTSPPPTIWPDAKSRLDGLELTFNNFPDRAIIPVEELRFALDAWGFDQSELDEQRPGSATFHIVPAYSHLQTSIVGTGFAHPEKVKEVIGLIRSLRILL